MSNDDQRELIDTPIKGGWKGPVDNPHEAEDLERLEQGDLVPPEFYRWHWTGQIAYGVTFFAMLGGVIAAIQWLGRLLIAAIRG